MNARALLASAILTATAGQAAEISTNGVGGGPWSDPATWRGKTVPGPDDDAVIRKYDVVTYDRSPDTKVTCRKLQIDPKGALTFKTGAGKLVFTVTDGIESFGVIRLDATRSASDYFELRLMGDTAAKRHVKLGKDGGLLLYGKPDLPDGRLNVALLSVGPADAKEDPEALVEMEGGVTLDWQRTAVDHVKLYAQKLDNTGAKPNERIRVRDCRFTGRGRVSCVGCDTPEFVRNTFENKSATLVQEPALHFHTSPLAEIKNNVVRGGFAIGIGMYAQTDTVVVANMIEKCTSGLHGGYGVPNSMIRQLTIRGCDTGIRFEGGSGVIEDVVIEGATTAFLHQNSTVQVTNLQVKELAKKGVAVLHETGGALTMLNCNVRPGDVKVTPAPPPAGKPAPIPVTCQQYVVIAVKGAPPGALVEVRTATPPPPAGTADPNVRNTPAAVVDGLTPLPQSLTGLIVKTWTIDPAAKLVPAPSYTVKVLGLAPKEGADRPVLATVPLQPAETAVRAAADDRTPTLEVTLK